MCATGPASNPPPSPQPQGIRPDGTNNNPPTGNGTGRARTRSVSPVPLPRRAGRIDDLVGPAMLRRGPLGPISDVSDPPSRSPKYISTPSCCSLAALPLIRDIPHGRMVYGSSSPPTPPPRPLFRSSHTHGRPSQSQQQLLTHTLLYITYTHTVHTTTTRGLPLWDLPPDAARCLMRASVARDMRRDQPPETWLCSTGRGRPMLALSYEIATQAQETHPSPSRSVLCRLTSASRSVDARSHGRRRVFVCVCVCVYWDEAGF